MFARTALVASLAWIALTPTIQARAENPISDFFHSFVQDYKRRNCWPDPFEPRDESSVREGWAANMQRGWEVQNMIADHHFDSGTSQLSEAGRLKVQWILTEAPAQHRVIYVHRALTMQETAARVAAVRQVAAQLVPPGEDLPVLETSVSMPSWSAERVDIIARKFNANMPNPALPVAAGASGGSGGGGAGSGSGGGIPGN